MAISDFRDFIYPVWYKDSNGNKISIQRTNETYTIVKNKILLKEIPDEYYKVNITNYYEIKPGALPSDNEFYVDYYTGEIVFNESQNGKTITVSSYYARGIVYIFAERVISEFDESNNNIKETLKDVVDNLTAKGDWNATTQYYKRNVVTYAGGSYIAIQDNIGINPSNVSYWQLISSPGLELNYRGEYDNLLSYVEKDAVSYGGSIYYCHTASTGNLPTNTSYWSLFMPRSVSTLLRNTVTIGDVPVSSVDIGITSFNPVNDDLLVYANSTYIEKDQDYTISGTQINKISGAWNAGTIFNFVVLKNVVQTLSYADGSLIQDGTITDAKLATSNKIGNLANLNTSDKTSIVNGINSHLADYAKYVAQPVYNVKGFGAKGDGVTDDTAAIQAAVNSINTSGGGVLFFPKGRYIISDSIILSEKTIIQGSGQGISIVECTNNVKYAFEYIAGNGLEEREAPKFFDIEIKAYYGIKLNDPNNGFTDDGTTQNYMMRPIIERCTITEQQQNYGIGIQWSKCFNGHIHKSKIRGFDILIELHGSDICSVENNRLQLGKTAQINIKRYFPFGSQTLIKHNDMLTLRNGGTAFIISEDAQIKIEDNYFEIPASTGNIIETVIKIVIARVVSIVNNRIEVPASVAPNWLTVLTDNLLLLESFGNTTSGTEMGNVSFPNDGQRYYYNNSPKRQKIIHRGNTITQYPFNSIEEVIYQGGAVFIGGPSLPGLATVNYGLAVKAKENAFLLPALSSYGSLIKFVPTDTIDYTVKVSICAKATVNNQVVSVQVLNGDTVINTTTVTLTTNYKKYVAFSTVTPTNLQIKIWNGDTTNNGIVYLKSVIVELA